VSTTDNSIATSGGNVTDEGGASVLARGVCWKISGSPLTTDAHSIDGTRSGLFSSTMTGLLNGTTYYVRAYATNVLGTVYGNQVTITTKNISTLTTVIPTLSNAEPGIVRSGGTITDDGGAAVTARGICWSFDNTIPDITDSLSTDGTGSGAFTSYLNGLDATKKYYIRAYATNAAGTAYGNVLIPTVPVVVQQPVPSFRPPTTVRQYRVVLLPMKVEPPLLNGVFAGVLLYQTLLRQISIRLMVAVRESLPARSPDW